MHTGATLYADDSPLEGSLLKAWIWLGLIVGTSAGGMVPTLWGDSSLSGWAVLFSVLGGFLGIWAGFKIGRMF